MPGLNRPSYLLGTGARVTTFFMLPEFARQDRVDFLPLSYRDIRTWLAAHPPEIVMVMCAPPGADGLCSFGAVTDFVADLHKTASVLIGHINPLMPATKGTPGIPYGRFTAVLEAPQPLRQSDPGSDSTAERIAAYAATLIPDGSTVQAGLGRIPEAILGGLIEKRHLAIHSGLIGDSTLRLLKAGALRSLDPVTAGVAIGSQALYNAVGGPDFVFAPPSVTHDIATLAGITPFISINSALEVDLDGQVHAEATNKGFMSGPGGASDFAAGARGQGGLRIVALPSTAANDTISRIVRTERATGPVSLSRLDTDVVITEHGIAHVRWLSHEAKRIALIAVAHPLHRKELAEC